MSVALVVALAVAWFGQAIWLSVVMNGRGFHPLPWFMVPLVIGPAVWPLALIEASAAATAIRSSIPMVTSRKRGGSTMSLPTRSVGSAPVMWCGRSWEGLVKPRCTAFAHAFSMREVTEADADSVVSSFLAFFAAGGRELFAHEEEWIFRSLGEHVVPPGLSRAYDDHVEITSLVDALFSQNVTGCVDLRVVRRLGELLEEHLLMEEEEIRPFVSRPPASLGRLGLASA